MGSGPRIAAFIALVFAVATAAAAPTVEIRAQTQLAVDKVRLLREGEAELSGQLIDRLTGDGIVGQEVHLKTATGDVTAVTDAEGRFHVILNNVEPGELVATLIYRGGPLIDGSETPIKVDPSRATLGLTLGIEEVLGGVKLTVTAKSDDTVVKLPIELSAGAPTDKELAPLAAVESGAPFVYTRKAAGGPGQRHVHASFAGDGVHQAATADATIDLVATSTTTLALAATRIAYEDDLVATGRVIDEDGNPIARAAVTLVAGDHRLAQGATGGDGGYKFTVEGKLVGGDTKYGDFGLAVQADPGRPSVRGSASPAVIVTIAKPEPVPVAYTIAAFLATALAAGAFFAARTKPWTRFRKKAGPAEAVATPAAELDKIVDGGLVSNKPGVMSTLRRPSDDGFSGVVRDTVRGRPVGEAVVRLLLGPRSHPTHSGPESTAAILDEREVRSGPDGSFLVERLLPGEWLAEVAAPGHVTEKFVVSIPHRGELRGVRVDLVPVRERVFQLYRRAAEPVLPETRLWGIWSPRQIVDHVRARRPSPALAELTDFVEEIYFSPRLAAETILPHASERVDRAIQERLQKPAVDTAALTNPRV